MAKLPSRKDLADRIDQLERDLLVFTAGGGAGAALARSAPLRAAAGGAALRLTPAALLADLVIRQEESLAYQAGEFVGGRFEGTEPTGVREGIVGKRGIALPKILKRKVSKSNKAVKQGMKWLKEGSKGVTGAIPGILPKGAFLTSVKAASMANPKTPSKIGKGKSIRNKLARKLKKWW
jgi:hypothetical protein